MSTFLRVVTYLATVFFTKNKKGCLHFLKEVRVFFSLGPWP